MLELDPYETVAAGDWHGNTAWAVRAVRYAHDVYGARSILHVGDFAFRFHPSYMAALHGVLGELGMRLFFVRGNHDSTGVLRENDPNLGRDPELWASDPEGDPWSVTGERIFYLPDGLRFQIGHETALVAGGAGSIDRSQRFPLVEWWPDERLDAASADRIIEQSATAEDGIDIVVAHDAPSGAVFPTNPRIAARFEEEDPGVLAWCEEHRAQLGRIVDAVAPRLVLHGHWHRYHDLIPPHG